jgi:hypothetical protein
MVLAAPQELMAVLMVEPIAVLPMMAELMVERPIAVLPILALT